MRFNTWALPRTSRVGRPLEEQSTNLSAKAKRQNSNNNSCLPPELTSVAPDCAISCLQTFVANSFGNPACEDSSDLTYLCRAISSSGYTLGEGGLQCLLETCSTQQSQKDVYAICSGIVGAQPKTQATITVTVNPSSTASGSLGTNIQVATVTPTSSNLFPSDTSTPPNLSSFGFVTASSPFPAPTAATADSGSKSGPGQLAGIAVGSAAGAFGLIGLMFFFCRRRRRQNVGRKAASPMPGAKSISLPSSASTSRFPSPGPKVEDIVPRQAVNPSPVDSIAAAMEAASAGVPASALVAAGNTNNLSPTAAKNQRTRSYWRKSIKPEEIGVAVTPKEENEFFRKSQGSSLAQNPRSMIPIPESAVLPTAFSPITTIGRKSGPTGERGTYAIAAAAAVAANGKQDFHSQKSTPIQPYLDGSQSYDAEKGMNIGDAEAQVSSPPASQHSLLASARASLVGLGTMLKRSVSLKRQSSDAKPLLKPTVYKATQPVNRYPLTPKYDNGNFEPNKIEAPIATLPAPMPEIPVQNFAIQRKPTFSSFVAGKLLHATNFKSPPPATGQDQPPAIPLLQHGRAMSTSSDDDYQSSYGTAPMNQFTEASQSEKTLAIPRGLSDVRSPAMMPAPLTIRKTPSTKTVRTQASGGTSGRGLDAQPQPPLPLNIGQLKAVDQRFPKLPTPRKARAMMGLGSPLNADEYARKPLPIPSHPPNEFANLAPISQQNRLSAIETLAAVKASQHDQAMAEVEDPEDFEEPLSTATSWLSVPVSTRPNTTRVTMVRSPPSHEDHLNSYQSLDSASPRGKPAFPSMAQSLNSIYTKYHYSTTSQLPTISPTSAIMLTAATYKPLTQHSPPVPPVPKSASQSSFLRDPSPMPGSGPDDSQSIQEQTSPGHIASEIQSNISSPPRFTKSINPYNPYFPSSPMRSKSTSSSRSQSLALSSHPTPAVPQFAYPDPSLLETHNDNRQNNGAYFRTPSLRPTIPGRNTSRQVSSLFSPDSADPRRESEGFPKVMVTPNKLPGGDLILTVDTAGKAYGV